MYILGYEPLCSEQHIAMSYPTRSMLTGRPTRARPAHSGLRRVGFRGIRGIYVGVYTQIPEAELDNAP
jgi:hypothetical protein